jgi:hypothetical protein
MAQVLVPNIILTKNYTLIKNLFFNKEIVSIESLETNEKDTFVLSTKNNKYLNAFEYAQTYDNKGLEVVVRIFDFDGKFELQYLSDGFLKKYFRSLLNKASNLSQLNSLAKAQIANKIYLSFGIGYDAKNWADPVSADLSEAYIEIDSSGRRFYTLKFTANNDSPLFRKNVFYNFERVNPEAEFNFLQDTSVSLRVSKTYSGNEKPNADIVLRDLIKLYLARASKTSTNNCILLLPELNSKFQSYYEQKAQPDISAQGGEEYKIYIGDEQEKNIKTSKYLDSFRELFGIIAEVKTNIVSVEVVAPSGNLNGFNKSKTEVLELIDAKQNKSLNIDSLPSKPFIGGNSGDLQFQDFVNNFTVETNFSNDPTKPLEKIVLDYNFTPNYNPVVPEIPPPVEFLLAQPSPPNFYTAPPTIKENKEIEWIFTLDINSFIGMGTPVKSNVLIDWYRPLNKINEGMNLLQGAQGQNAEFIVDVESNLLQLDLLRKNNIIENTELPCIIAGDNDCIRNYYHRDGLYLDSDMSPESNTSFGPLKPLADLSLKNQLTSKSYITGLYNLLSRKRNYSAFGEKAILDELSDYNFNTKDTNNKFLNFLANNEYLKLTDTPIFMHNLKNSNVLAITVAETIIPYLQTLGLGISEASRSNEVVLQAPSQYQNSLIYYNTKLNFENLVNKIIKNYKESLGQRQLFTDQNTSIDPFSVDIGQKIIEETVQQRFDRDLGYQFTTRTPAKVNPKTTNFLNFLTSNTKATEVVRRNILVLLGENIGREPVSNFRNNGNQNNLIFSDYFDDTQIQQELLILSDYIAAVITAGVDNNQSFFELTKKIIVGENSSESLKARIFRHLYEKMGVVISVRTLPFFWLCGPRIINKEAIVLSKKPPALISPKNDQVTDISDLFDNFSGVHNIIGVKHIINTTECYSEFVLARKGLTEGTLGGH